MGCGIVGTQCFYSLFAIYVLIHSFLEFLHGAKIPLLVLLIVVPVLLLLALVVWICMSTCNRPPPSHHQRGWRRMHDLFMMETTAIIMWFGFAYLIIVHVFMYIHTNDSRKTQFDNRFNSTCVSFQATDSLDVEVCSSVLAGEIGLHVLSLWISYVLLTVGAIAILACNFGILSAWYVKRGHSKKSPAPNNPEYVEVSTQELIEMYRTVESHEDF